MKTLIAIDSLKGCLTSDEANAAAAEAVRDICPDAIIGQVPVSDGGEGFLTAFHAAIGGTETETVVADALMRPVKARYLLNGTTAVIESAQASGLTLLTEQERNPLAATSYGTGQLVADAVRRGATHLIIGLGGSATSDAGIGMLRALVDAFAEGGTWDDVTALKDIRVTIASDVRNPLCGENGAAQVFAPQKGATPAMVARLDDRAARFARLSARHFGYDRSTAAGAGAAGGMGYACMQYLHAEYMSGIDLLLQTIGFRQMARQADIIITGEGRADRQTLMGKVPTGILRHAGSTPVALLAGSVSDRDLLLQAGFAHVDAINPPGFPLAEAMKKEVAQAHIRQAIHRLFQSLIGH